jgi:hypothetical protein
MTLQVLNGPIIAAGESLSDGVDCSAGSIVRFTMPAGWTSANLTFQISSDGNGYNDLVNINGTPLSLPVVPGSAVVLGQFQEYLRAIAFIKFRSGTKEHPIVQSVQRDFAIAIEVS